MVEVETDFEIPSLHFYLGKYIYNISAGTSLEIEKELLTKSNFFNLSFLLKGNQKDSLAGTMCKENRLPSTIKSIYKPGNFVVRVASTGSIHFVF